MKFDPLAFVQDQSPLSMPSLRHTHWQADMSAQTAPVVKHERGYTVTIVENRWLSWYRSFTPDVPPRPVASARVVLHEWVPTRKPLNAPGWQRFGRHHFRAIADLAANYRHAWQSQTKRHLKTFEKQGCTLRLGTLDDLHALYPVSQVPLHFQRAFLKVLGRHLDAHPQDIEILVADHEGKPIACMVVGNCDEIQESDYLIGAFDTAHAPKRAMHGLMDWWYRRSLERGYRTVNFGIIDPRPRFPWSEKNGYSIFKTQFGVKRVWFPSSHWKIVWQPRHRS